MSPLLISNNKNINDGSNPNLKRNQRSPVAIFKNKQRYLYKRNFLIFFPRFGFEIIQLFHNKRKKFIDLTYKRIKVH